MYYLIATIATIVIIVVLVIWEALAEFAQETRKPE